MAQLGLINLGNTVSCLRCLRSVQIHSFAVRIHSSVAHFTFTVSSILKFLQVPSEYMKASHIWGTSILANSHTSDDKILCEEPSLPSIPSPSRATILQDTIQTDSTLLKSQPLTYTDSCPATPPTYQAHSRSSQCIPELSSQSASSLLPAWPKITL
jgi:hypothetical protein